MQFDVRPSRFPDKPDAKKRIGADGDRQDESPEVEPQFPVEGEIHQKRDESKAGHLWSVSMDRI